MAWRDSLRKASFRGVPFFVTSANADIGRRLARHEYPQRDVPWLEDMGRRAREYKVEAFVLGTGYMRERDALMKALETAGPGQLVHPWHGTVSVTASEVSLTESTDSGGIARFSMTFVEAGARREPQASIDSIMAIQRWLDSVYWALADDFSSQFSITGLPEFAVNAAASALDSALSVIAGLHGKTSPLGDLLASPRALASGLIDAVKSVEGAENRLLSPQTPPSEPLLYLTATRAAILRNARALSSLTLSAATAKRIGGLTDGAPKTLEDARSARLEIAALSDAVILESTGGASSDAMIGLRGAAVTHFMRMMPDLPSLATITPLITRPAIVHAHEFYDTEWLANKRDEEIVARNAVRHPGFVPAGKPLQFVV